MEALEAELVAARAAGDGASIAQIYGEAADRAEAQGRVEEACFLWVNAYVFALEAGSAAARKFHARLVAHGREA